MASNKSPAILLCATLFLTVAAGLLLLAEEKEGAHQEKKSQEFQDLVRGLGMGPALDLSICPFCFDPRIGFICDKELGPLPGGIYLCPQHACSVFYYPPLQKSEVRSQRSEVKKSVADR